MDDRRRTLAAVTIVVGFLLLVALTVGLIVSRKKILSPVPEDSGIRIIFITPTPTVIALTPTPALAR